MIFSFPEINVPNDPIPICAPSAMVMTAADCQRYQTQTAMW